MILEYHSELQKLSLKVTAHRPIILSKLIGRLTEVNDSLSDLEIKPFRLLEILLVFRHPIAIVVVLLALRVYACCLFLLDKFQWFDVSKLNRG